MPRPPTVSHPLRAIRAATSCPTQAAFARLIGVATPTVQAIENGKLKLTPKLAARIREATGADEAELLKGAKGKPRAAGGGAYSREFFDRWQEERILKVQTDGSEKIEQARIDGWLSFLLEAARAKSPEALPAARRLMAEAVDHVRQRLDLTDAVHDRLTPWQNAEIASMEAAQWKKAGVPLQERCGWDAAMKLPPKLKLTLSLQTVPRWDVEKPPPGMGASNVELFPPCYFTVAAGRGGCELASAFWRTLCREHAVDPGNGRAARDYPSGSWQGFFRRTGDPGRERCVPHAVFCDLDPQSVQAVSQRHGELFHPGGLIAAKTGSGNSFAAARGREGQKLAAEVQQFMERQSEDAGSPSGILVFLSLEGGTGSGLGTLIMEQLRARYPAVPVLVVAILPPEGTGHVVTGPYNTCLALRTIFKEASLVLLVDNASAQGAAEDDWKLKNAGLAEADLVVAEALAALTTPMRFAGAEAPPLDLPRLAECFRPESEAAPWLPPVIGINSWPMVSLTGRKKERVPPGLGTAKLLRAALLSGLLGRETVSAGVFVRGRYAPPARTATRRREPPRLELSFRRVAGAHESVTLAAPFPFLYRRLEQIAEQAAMLWQRKAFAHACVQGSVNAEMIEEAIETVRRAGGSDRTPASTP